MMRTFLLLAAALAAPVDAWLQASEQAEGDEGIGDHAWERLLKSSWMRLDAPDGRRLEVEEGTCPTKIGFVGGPRSGNRGIRQEVSVIPMGTITLVPPEKIAITEVGTTYLNTMLGLWTSEGLEVANDYKCGDLTRCSRATDGDIIHRGDFNFIPKPSIEGTLDSGCYVLGGTESTGAPGNPDPNTNPITRAPAGSDTGTAPYDLVIGADDDFGGLEWPGQDDWNGPGNFIVTVDACETPSNTGECGSVTQKTLEGSKGLSRVERSNDQENFLLPSEVAFFCFCVQDASPSGQPSGQPSEQPSAQPSGQPSNRPSSSPVKPSTAAPTTFCKAKCASLKTRLRGPLFGHYAVDDECDCEEFA